MTLTAKTIGVICLLLLTYSLGANQKQIGNWFADREHFKKLALSGSTSKEAQREKEIYKWISNLQKGGYIIFLRHASREKWPEVTAFDVYEFQSRIEDSSQTSFKRAVCLSEQGIEEAKLIGKIFSLARIPTGTVVSSPSCRAKQTAFYAFGKYDFVDNSIRFPKTRDEQQERNPTDRLMVLLRNVDITPGTNTVISGHSVNFGQYRGRGLTEDWYDATEPLETGFTVLERKKDNTIAVLFTFKSISDLASAQSGSIVGSK